MERKRKGARNDRRTRTKKELFFKTNDNEHSQQQHDNPVVVKGVWNEDTRLAFWADIQQYKSIFSDASLLSVHPAIIEDANLAYYFSLEEDELNSSPTPLLLNITTALLIGIFSI